MLDESDKIERGSERINPETLRKLILISTQILGIDPSFPIKQRSILNSDLHISSYENAEGSLQGMILICFPPDEMDFFKLYMIFEDNILSHYVSIEDLKCGHDRVVQIVDEQKSLGLSRINEIDAQELFTQLVLFYEHMIDSNDGEGPFGLKHDC